jgi:hypothetical protein
LRIPFAHQYFYDELKSSLASSTEAQRRSWAQTIIHEDISLKDLSSLLSCGDKAASRFLWLLSDIGISKPKKLFAELPFLFELVQKEHTNRLTSFASYWHYVGVPEENEAQAIDLLFKWFLSAETNVTTKTRALWALLKLSEKFPELKQEIKLCLKDQKDKYSRDFRKRAEKILAAL